MGALEKYLKKDGKITPEMVMYVSSLELVNNVSPDSSL